MKVLQRIRWYIITCREEISYYFTVSEKKFCFSLHYNGPNSYLFVNDIGIIKFKAKDSEIAVILLYLGNISEDFAADNMRKKKMIWICL